MDDLSVGIIGPWEYPDRGALFRALDTLRVSQYFLAAEGSFNQDVIIYLGKTQSRSIRNVIIAGNISELVQEEQLVIKKWGTQIIELKLAGDESFRMQKIYIADHSAAVCVFVDEEARLQTEEILMYSRTVGKKIKVFPLVRFDEKDVLLLSKEEFVFWLNSMKEKQIDLQSIKGIILDYIEKNLLMTMKEFMVFLGTSDENNLESWFYR